MAQTYKCHKCGAKKEGANLAFQMAGGPGPIEQITFREFKPARSGRPDGGWAHAFTAKHKGGVLELDSGGNPVYRCDSLCPACLMKTSEKGLIWLPS